MIEEKVYRALLSESEIDVLTALVTEKMTLLPDVHESGEEYLKLFEILNELKIATEVEINNKMQ